MNDKEFNIYKERALIVEEILGAYMHVRESNYVETEDMRANRDGKSGSTEFLR